MQATHWYLGGAALFKEWTVVPVLQVQATVVGGSTLPVRWAHLYGSVRVAALLMIGAGQVRLLVIGEREQDPEDVLAYLERAFVNVV